jgi:N-acyl-D-aspartate/D-glutamate deacylase
MFDLLIANAEVADGLGSPLRHADVAVKDGRIAAVGRDLGPASQTVDANGLVLAPGVIDVHTHYDAQLTWDSTASPSPALGVTTVVIGNCGFGIAPATPATRDTLLKNLSEVEAMSLDALRAGVDWQFNDFSSYLDFLAKRGVTPNVASFCSHSALRTVVMGDAGSEREANKEELAQITEMFDAALTAGAIGLGSSTFENHNGYDGIPVPSRLASDDEFRALARVMARHGHGVTMATCGDRSPISFMEELAALSGRPVIYCPLLDYPTKPERAPGVSIACAEARGRGHAVYAQASCQPLNMNFTLLNAYLLTTIAPWPTHGDAAHHRAQFADPDFRAAFKRSLAVPDTGGRIFNGTWNLMEVTLSPTQPTLEGRTIEDIARERGVDPVDALLDIGLADDLKTTFLIRLLNVDEKRVGDLIAEDGNLVSLSDAGAHLTLFCDAGYAMHLLGRWVRELGRFSLPHAIRKLTSDPAHIYGILDRGRIAVGAWADLMLFDPATIHVGKAHRVADLPAGASRLIRSAPGLHGVWVNGTQVFDGKDYLKVKPPGQVLRQFSTAKPTLAMPLARAAE